MLRCLGVLLVVMLPLALLGCSKESVGLEKPVDEKANNELLEQRLIGAWRTDPSDVAALERWGSVRLSFEEDGALAYVIEGDTKDQVMLLTFKVDGNELVTDQPSAPRVERTRFRFTPDGRLLLEYGEGSVLHVRIPTD